MDQTTPRAERKNPFESHFLNLRPTFHHHLLSPQLPSPAQAQAPNYFASGQLTPTVSGTAPSALPTTHLTLHAPVFNMQKPPAPNTRSNKSSHSSPSSANPAQTVSAGTVGAAGSGSGGGSRGQIHVKLVQARGLAVSSMAARPYVVVQFEQNEFVSRDPTDETDKALRGTAITKAPTNGTAPSLAMNALGAINSKVANMDINKRSSTGKGSSNSSPASSVGSSGSVGAAPTSGATASSSGLFGRLSAPNPVWKHEVSFDVTSEQSLITFNVYDRACEDQKFLGTLQIKPVFVHDHTVDQWYKLRPYENEEVTGEMRIQITFEQYKVRHALTPRDFEFLKLIGRGTFGKVFQVRKRDTKRIYAMKVLSKKEIIAKKEVAHTIGERKILQRSLECPFLVGLKFSFQTDRDLYLVTDFKSGGELFWHLQKETRFTEERARFYIAELVLALEHLHKYDIVYRDLKPENILLDATGHVALCDFGLSKADLPTDQLTQTFCGTTEYLAPEILLDEHGYSKIVDFWSLGVLLFEMCCGWSPFYAEDTQQMYKNICFGRIRFPRGVIGEDGKQFVKGLLNRNPKHRLGAQRDAAELKEHPFFKSIDWTALTLKQVTPPFKPNVESDESTANFDVEFTGADISSFQESSEESLDEEDPSEDWVSLQHGQQVHTPNGPLGSDHTGGSSSGRSSAIPLTPIQPHPASRETGSGGTPRSQGIEIKPKKKKGGVGASGSPLTNSVQENFKGFTYHGGESVVIPNGIMGGGSRNPQADEDALDLDASEPTTEDEYEDGKHAGRYARRGRGSDNDMDL